MNKRTFLAAVLATSYLGTLRAQQPTAPPSGGMMMAPGGMTESRSMVELRMAMRKLWEDHITYTRNYIISALADLSARETGATKLLEHVRR